MECNCKTCKYLSFSDFYGECDKHVKIVRPNDKCPDYEPKHPLTEKR